MSKNQLIIALWLVFFTPMLLAQAPARPNILLLMAEDMSSRVGAFDDEVATTPNLDALAREGVRYTNTFTTAGVCAPSRAAHILGMHQISTGTQHMRTSSRPEGGYFAVPPEGVKAYPELLRAAGYYTFTDSKLDYQFSKPFANSGPSTIWDSEGATAPDWRGRAQGQPFYGFRSFMDTHESGVFRPLGSWPNSITHFVMQVMRWWRAGQAVEALTDRADIQLPPYYPDTPTVRADLARHYDNISSMDAKVGAILKQLEADGLADSTIVIWTTDHGDGLPRAKRELYDSGIKVPMIIRWPDAFRPAGVKPNDVDARLISFVDLAPTILKLAGVELPMYLHGQDFSSPKNQPRRYIAASRDRIDEVMDRQRAVRDERFKYIRSWYPEQPESTGVEFRDNVDMVREMRQLYAAGKLDAIQRQWFEAPGEERLFDLHADPNEINDLSTDPEHKETLEQLRAAMHAWLAHAKDWSDEPEADMIARFEPNGEQQVTPAPSIALSNGVLTLTAAAAGHSLSYRLNEGPWRLYIKPVKMDKVAKVEALAVRYGWKTSEIVIPRE